ncbi:formate dehydrogenase subunit gamma [Marinomonas sp. 15G1-11]|uniref:NADH-quinone oxidoreductase subunit E n=1 Tax=Marinomonas phaeophyticola TaxID=3004091 RepID=A0ABT4JX47_9GAMM|nr:formate dehydrogenase subunit gamma [Marinomonas sp. 15G1-11]MCZ2722657.1 formate dehydrogenase subunit gamma [Marinomonas sp. 15G1-11]
MTNRTQWNLEQVTQIIASLKDTPGAMLPILHGIQDTQGYVPPDAVPMIAEALNQTRAEVHGVISFYHLFRTTPPGKHVVQICRAEACQARGARALEAHVKAKLHIDYNNTTLDQEFTLEPIYCLGNCACGPSIRVDDDIVGRVTTDKFDLIVDELTTVALDLAPLNPVRQEKKA